MGIEDQARSKVYNAIIFGRLVPAETCEKCGKPPKGSNVLHGHHDDYSKPLDVRWLCGSCHKRHHIALRKANGTYTPGGPKPKKARVA